MSQFYAYDFMYDDIPSQRFNLKIITFEDGGLFNGVGSTDVNILTQKVLRKSKPYYLGRTQEPVLEFPLTFGTAAPISGMDRDMISTWLFGRSEYKKLYILQDDLNGAYFNCFLTKPEPLYIGGVNYAFQCTVVCDSPWAYSPEKNVGFEDWYYDGVNPYTIEIYNSSSEDDYLYPIVHFILGTSTPSNTYQFSIINNTDNNRVFSFSSLLPGDDITIDNDLQIIGTVEEGGNTINASSPRDPSILSVFNKNWLRLLPRYNKLWVYPPIQDTIDLLEIRYTERLKIGG